MKKYFFKCKKPIFIYFLSAFMLFVSIAYMTTLYEKISLIIENKRYDEVKSVVMKSIIIVSVIAICFFMYFKSIRYFTYNTSYNIRKDIFEKIYSLDYETFMKREKSYYVSLLVNDVSYLEENYFGKVLEIISNVLQVGIYMVMLLMYGWEFCLVTCLFLIIAFIQPMCMKKFLGDSGRSYMDKMERYTGKVNELIKGFYSIRGVGKSQKFLYNYQKNLEELKYGEIELNKLKTINSVFAFFSVYIVRVGTQLFFASSALKGIVDAASVATLMMLVIQVCNPVGCFLSIIEPINSTSGIRKKITEFLEEEFINDNSKAHVGEIYHIEMKNVTFSYDEKNNSLECFSHRFDRGKKYALVGKSGCGKSTVIKLLMGYYMEYEGNIIYNLDELRNINKNSLKKRINYILQQAYVDIDTIENNITFEKKVDKNYIRKIFGKVQLQDIYNKRIEDNTDVLKLSGGEKQRIELARALFNSSDVIYMDEGTSALDNFTAQKVEEKILDSNKTIIAIVHRFNENIRKYDEICYMENGRIVECGSYDQLIAKKGAFYNSIMQRSDQL